MKKFKKIFAFLLLASIFIGCVTTKNTSSSITKGQYVVDVKGYSEDGFKVATTIDGNGRITDIIVNKHTETDGIGSKVIESLPSKIIDSQSLAVDAIAGATETSNALFSGVEQALVMAGLDIKNYQKVPPKTKGEDIEKVTDVVVIGGGGAGLSAAVSAAQNGAKVILVEKTSFLGGNTVRAGGPYNAVDEKRLKNSPKAGENTMSSIDTVLNQKIQNDRHKELIEQLKKDINEYKKSGKDYLFDSLALHTLQTYTGGDFAGKIEFIEKLVTEALPTAEWLENNGLQWRDELATVPGGLWPRAHVPVTAAGKAYITTNEALAKNLDVEIILDCSAKNLIMDGDRVVGIEAEMSDGSKVTIKSNRGVVIATGGFAANKEMRKKYDSSLVEALGTTNSSAIQGDGIVMAEKVGANLIGMEYIQSLPLGNPKTGGLNGWVGGRGVEFYYQINKEGKRFMAEDGRRDVMTAALISQTDSFSYVITHTNKDIETGVNIWGENIEDLVKNGTIYKADTIEDLAKQIGVDPKVLKETHETFNEYIKTGYDKDYSRKLFGEAINTSPFYASPRIPTVHHTMGGIEITLNGEVVRKDGTIIKGLYAAGEVTGGIHGKNRLGGNALVDIHVFGKIAGESAARIK